MNIKINFIQGAWRVLLALVFALSLVGIPSGHASAETTLTVNSTGDGADATPGNGVCETGTGNGVCTLRAAIQEANAFAGADTITFSFSGTITLGSSLPAITSELTIDGTGQNVTISGNHLYRVMDVYITVVTLNHLSIVNGNVTGISGSGGGIQNYGTLSVRNCTFSGNQALRGGAIYTSAGTLQFLDSTFDGNIGTQYGGAIYSIDSSLTIANSTFSGNTSSINGGAIDGDQFIGTNTMSVTNSTFANNSAGSSGGGIENSSGTLTVTNSSFSGNSAVKSGGGIDDSGTLHLKNTILANSTSGGDCREWGTTASDSNNLIEVNSGCGTPVSSADPVLGPLADNGGPTQTFALLAGSPAIDAGDDATCAEAPVSNKDQRGVIRPYGSACDIGAYEYFLPTISGNVGIAGATLDYFDGTSQSAVADGSGNYSFVVSYNWSGAVIPSKPNYTFSPDHLDYGNLQADATNQNYTAIPVTLVVNSTGDGADATPGNGVCETGTGNGVCTLRAAVEEANSLAGAYTITFSVSGTITLESSLPDITSELTIDGTGQNVTISGNHLYRVMLVDSTVVTLNNLSIINGEGFGNAGGGGIYAFNATLTVTNCTFSGNNGTYGGAIQHMLGTLTVANSTFSGNSADNEGGAIESVYVTLVVTDSIFSGNSGIYAGGIDITSSTASITNSTFSGNSATNFEGGGIFSNHSPLTISNSTFSGNSAEYGGAIISWDESLTITNSTFSDNTAAGNGGAIFIIKLDNPSTLALTNSTFSGNNALNGGALYNSAGSVTVTNSTFSANFVTTGRGGGIYDDGGTLNLSNSILANSTATEDCYRVSSAPDVNVNNLIENYVNCGAPSSIADPMLGSLVNNGGTTQTFALRPGSPAIDAGDDATCAAAPVNNLDQRGVTRPVGAHCDIGALEARNESASRTLYSVGANDGWILESGESTNAGGTRNSTDTTFRLGDEIGDKQYRAILSFNTAALPDNAVITRVTLKIKRPATGFLVGNNSPFAWGIGLKVDVCRNFFGTSAALQMGDFNFTNATNCKLLAGAFGGTPAASWYSANILSTAFTRISKIGTTQFRLRFAKDDNDDGAADYMKFYSGNYATATVRPMLVIEYYVP